MNGLAYEPWVAWLASADYQQSNQATEEIFNRGETMFDLLLNQQGNQKPFMGTLLGNPQSATVTVKPLPGFPLSPSQQEKVVTVEVASLYLISAIYYQRLDFAQNPLLADLKLPPGERVAANKKEYITRAFQAVKEWVRKSKQFGMVWLRKQGEDPLKGVKLCWW